MRIFLFALSVVSLAACTRDNLVWTEIYNFRDNRWDGKEQVVFVPDTLSLSSGVATKGIITFRYGVNADVESFPLIMEMECAETGEYRCDSIQVQLLPMSLRNGNNSKVGIFELNDTIGLRQPPGYGWRIAFRQPSLQEAITGIFSLIFTLEK